MAFLPIAHVAVNYRDYGGHWIKAYEVGTTTPKPMALKSTGENQVAKLQLNVDGFIVSSGDALVIPYVDGIFDMWLFPTEAEADSNNTTNSLRIADGSQGEDGVNISDKSDLIDGQTTVPFTKVNAITSVFYIQGDNVDIGLLTEGINNDYTVTDGSTIELTSSYPSGSFIAAYGSIEVPTGEVFSVHGRVGVVTSENDDYTASQVTNIPSGEVSSTNVQGAINELSAEVSAAKLNNAIYNKQVGTAYTLTPDDSGKTVSMNNAAANVATIDTNANQAILATSVILLSQIGAGVTTLSAVAGVEINGIDGGSVVFSGPFDTASIDQYEVDKWRYVGTGTVS